MRKCTLSSKLTLRNYSIKKYEKRDNATIRYLGIEILSITKSAQIKLIQYITIY